MPTDTPLHKAAHNGDLPAVKLILEGEEPVAVDEPGAAERRALHRAAGGNHVEVAKYLISKGAVLDQTDKSGRTALHWAAISGHKEACEYLIGVGANMFALTTSKMSPLHGATEGGRIEIVRLLVTSAGARKDEMCNIKDDAGKTPCDLAVAGGHKPVIKLLKELGDPNAASVACVIS